LSPEIVALSGASASPWTPGPAQRRPGSATGIGLSIFQKLLLLLLSLIFVTVALPAVYLSARQLSRMQMLLELKAEMYARLVGKQVESAVAFNDKETAREVFESIVQDAELVSVTLFTGDGGVLQSYGQISPSVLSTHAMATRAEVIVMADRVAAVTPVMSLEGPHGALVLELSTQRLKTGRADVLAQALVAGALALFVGAAGAFWIARSLGNRLEAIARVAGIVAQGRLDEPELDDIGRDEIGSVAAAFNAMLQQLRTLINQIQRGALEEQRRLGQLVAERTSELDTRNADMRLVLDHVGQGFVMLGRDAKMSRERSAILERWLGPAPPSDAFADYLGVASPRVGEWFQLGWEAVIDGALPLDLALDQLPKSLTLGQRVLDIAYRPIVTARGELERVLVVLSDLTPELERSRAEADERELTLLGTRLINDRDSIVEFRAEVEALLGDLGSSSDTDSLRRWLHTLKGSTSLYGVDSMAALCHELEEQLNEPGAPTAGIVAPLVQRWAALRTKLDPLLETQSGRIQIEVDEYEALLAAIEQGAPRALIQRTLADWRLEPVHARLARLAEHAERLAERLDKAPIEVHIDAGKLRLAREPWGEFWSAAVHVVRNAVDHGLEDPDERRRLGKRVPAQIELAAWLDGAHFVLEFKDDGRGVDWSSVAAEARANGLPADTKEDLLEALFASGISTRTTATDVSGRGVGLDVLRAACRRSGGAIEVESQRGQGTTFRCSWPIERLEGGCSSGLHAPISQRTPTRPKEQPLVSPGTIAPKGPLQIVSK
jgi:signal transduction histidine kinase